MLRSPRLQITLEPRHFGIEVTFWTHHHDYTTSDHYRATLTAMPIHAPYTQTHHEWSILLDTTGWLWRPFRYRGPDSGNDGDSTKTGYRRGFHWLAGAARHVTTTYTTMRPIIPRPDYHPFGGPRG